MTIINTFQIKYSLKNVPIVSKKQYQKSMTSKLEVFLERMRWKLFWYKNPEIKKTEKKTFGFKSAHYPPASRELKSFEDELIAIVSNVEMRPTTNELQKQMKDDIEKIRNCREVIAGADKTSNHYLIQPDQYKKHLTNTISKEYRKAPINTVKKIDAEAASIAN